MYPVPKYEIVRLQQQAKFLRARSLTWMDEGDRARALYYQGESESLYRYIRALMGMLYE